MTFEAVLCPYLSLKESLHFQHPSFNAGGIESVLKYL